MDRRYQVFISSTFTDLKEERRETMMALLESDAIPAGMELFQASNDDQWSYIKQVIDQCDYYLLIVGGRYGSVSPSGLSYTEMEYDYAVTKKKPVITFVKDGIEDLPAKHVEDSPEGRLKLTSFREKVMKSRMCRKFSTAQELGGLVGRSYLHAKKNSPAEGWVPGRYALTPELQSEIAELRGTVLSLRAELQGALTAPPAGAEELSQGDDLYMVHMKWLHGQPYSSSAKERNYEQELSWDQIFGSAGPLLMEECEDGALQRGLAFALFPFFSESIRNEMDPFRRNLTILTDDYQNIKVQLMALGLIGTSEKRRGVNDKGTYWTLTALGRTSLTRLRAIRKDGRHFYSPPEENEGVG